MQTAIVIDDDDRDRLLRMLMAGADGDRDEVLIDLVRGQLRASEPNRG